MLKYCNKVQLLKKFPESKQTKNKTKEYTSCQYTFNTVINQAKQTGTQTAISTAIVNYF